MSNELKHPLLRVVISTSLVGAMVFAETAFSAQPVFEGIEVIEFESVSYTYAPSPFKVKQAKKLGVPVETKTEPSIRLTGYLAKPTGDGPLASVVLLHTCAGISEHEEMWSDTLVSWGYVVLTVDSLTPRGVKYICDLRPGSMTPWSRALDAYGAKRYLSTRPFVDPTRITVIGMSHGGTTIPIQVCSHYSDASVFSASASINLRSGSENRTLKVPIFPAI